MKNARVVLAGLLAGVATVATAPAASAADAYQYVTVERDGSVVRISTQIPGQPLFGGWADTATGWVCVGFSYQVPQCAKLPLDAISYTDPLEPFVTLDLDPSDGSVGVGTHIGRQPLLGVRYYTDGRLCAGFSYQVPFCVGPIEVD